MAVAKGAGTMPGVGMKADGVPALPELPTPGRSERISVKLQTNVNLQLERCRGEA